MIDRDVATIHQCYTLMVVKRLTGTRSDSIFKIAITIEGARTRMGLSSSEDDGNCGFSGLGLAIRAGCSRRNECIGNALSSFCDGGWISEWPC